MVWHPSSPKKISHPHAICRISGRGLPFACCTAERCNRLFQGYTRLKRPRLEPEGHRQDCHPHVTWAAGIKLHILQGDPPGAKWLLWLRHIGRVPWFFATGHCCPTSLIEGLRSSGFLAPKTSLRSSFWPIRKSLRHLSVLACSSPHFRIYGSANHKEL